MHECSLEGVWLEYAAAGTVSGRLVFAAVIVWASQDIVSRSDGVHGQGYKGG